jgi:hypothetical protein
MCDMTDTYKRAVPDQALASPIPQRMKRSSWLDLRLITGVVLVIGAVLVGAVLVSSADQRNSVWALQRDVAAGTVLRDSDLKSVRVQLGSSAEQYLSVGDSVAGRTVRHPLQAGELLPRSELRKADLGVLLTIPVRPDDAPRISQGDRITVWVTTRTCRGVVLLGGVAVQDVRAASNGALSGSSFLGVQVRLPVADANRVVGVLDLDGVVVRAGILSADVGAPQPEPGLSRCVSPAP